MINSISTRFEFPVEYFWWKKPQDQIAMVTPSQCLSLEAKEVLTKFHYHKCKIFWQSFDKTDPKWYNQRENKGTHDTYAKKIMFLKTKAKLKKNMDTILHHGDIKTFSEPVPLLSSGFKGNLE